MKKIKQQLSSASCVLLGITSSVYAESEPWLIDLGIMSFNEQGRNDGLELIVKGSRDTQDGGMVSLTAGLDVITGATPNGATSSNIPQVFTMASGVNSYTVKANELPVDDTHMDIRMALTADIKDPLAENLTADYSALLSMEFDYLAMAAGGSLSWDFNRKNTTLISGINLEYNRVHPVGNIAIPFAQMQPEDSHQPRGVSAKTKSGNEISFGLNQIIDQTSLFQIRFNYSEFSGYLTDSYKLLSVVDDENILSLGQTQSYIYEKRPSSRLMKSLYLGYKKSYQPGMLDFSYRLFEDDWNIHSHTVEVVYKFQLEKRYFIRPNVRLYKQGAAFFYAHSLKSSQLLPDYASADNRLAEFDATTLGIEIGKDLAFDRKQSLTIEYYTQQGTSHPDDAVGLQQQQDLYPTFKSWVIKYVYSFKW